MSGVISPGAQALNTRQPSQNDAAGPGRRLARPSSGRRRSARCRPTCPSSFSSFAPAWRTGYPACCIASMVSCGNAFSNSSTSGRYWWWKRGAFAASCTFSPLSTTLMRSFATVVIIVDPPRRTQHQPQFAGSALLRNADVRRNPRGRCDRVADRRFADNCRRHRTQRPLPGSNRVRWPLNQAKAVGHTHLAGKVVHLVVQQKAKARHGHADPKPKLSV